MNIYVFLCFFLCFFTIIVSILLTKSVINPIIPVAIVWIIVIYNSVTLNKLVLASNYIYGYIFWGLLSFMIGSILFFKIDIFQTSILKNKEKLSIRKSLIYILFAICILFYLRNILVLHRSGVVGYESTITSLQSGLDLGYSNIDALISYYVVNPCRYAIPAVTITEYFYGNKEKLLLGLTIIMLVLNSISTGSKSVMMLFFLFLIIAMLIKNNIFKFSFKKYVAVLLSIFIAIFLFQILASARGQAQGGLVQYELGISPRMFEIWLGEVNSRNIYGFGEATLMGFLYPIVHTLGAFLPLFDFLHINNIYSLIQQTDSVWVYPGPAIKANAYVSAFWFFYLDFRIWGIILYSFITGVVASIVFKYSSIAQNKLWISIYMIIFYQLIFSFVRFGLTTEAGALAFLYIFLLWKNE